MFESKARDQFQNIKGTENEIRRFWGISNKNANTHEKILLQMLFGAFHITSRILQSCARDLRPALINSLGLLVQFRNH